MQNYQQEQLVLASRRVRGPRGPCNHVQFGQPWYQKITCFTDSTAREVPVDMYRVDITVNILGWQATEHSSNEG